MAKEPNNKTPSAEEKAREIAVELKADVLLLNAPMDEPSFGSLVMGILQNHRYKKVIVILTTFGGDAGAAYRMGRFLQYAYKDITMLIPSYCKSAGTLLAICAHRIMVTPFGHIGPLDVQLRRPNELGERRSGLVLRYAFESLQDRAFFLWQAFMYEIKRRSYGNIDFSTASRIATEITVGLMEPIFAQIDPERVGEDYRDNLVAQAYGETLAEVSKNIDRDSIHKLVHSYPSHDFIIDEHEMKKLFKNVVEPGSELTRLLTLLGEQAISPRIQSKEALIKILSVDKKPESADNQSAAEAAPAAAEAAPKAAKAPGRARRRADEREQGK